MIAIIGAAAFIISGAVAVYLASGGLKKLIKSKAEIKEDP